MGKKLYVGNLGYDVTEGDLSQLFGQHGSVTSSAATSRSNSSCTLRGARPVSRTSSRK